MSVRSGQSITVLFTTRVWATGVGTNADSLPTGTLYINGTSNAASVTVTNISTGLYKAAVTLPTLAIGDEVEIAIAATVSSVSDKAVIWGDTKDTALDGSGLVTFSNTSIATAGAVTGNVGGNIVGNVAGDVQGKVLGGGASSFTAVGVQADAQKWAGQTTLLDANNLPKVNVTDWNGTVAPALPTNFTSLVIDSSGRVDLSKWGGTALAGTIPPDVVFIRSGTAQGGGTSSITLDSGASSVNNLYQNCVVLIRSGTGAGQCAIATSYTGSTKVLVINGNWATVPDNTSVFSLLPFGLISATVSGNVTVGGYASGQDPATYILVTPAQKIVTTAAGRVDVGLWLGQAVTLDANNIPNVNVKDWNATAVGNLPANFAALGIGATGHITNVDTIANVVPLPTVDGKTHQQAMQYIAAMVAGKLPSGAGSGTEAYLGLDGVTTRVTMTVDISGNRTAVVYN